MYIICWFLAFPRPGVCKVQDQGDHEALPGGPSEIVPVCGLLTAIVSVNPQCWKPNEHPITQLHYRRDRYENVTLFWVDTSVSGSLTHHDCKHEGLSQVQILWQKISNQLNYLATQWRALLWHLFARQKSRSSFNRRIQWTEKGKDGAGALEPSSDFLFPHRKPAVAVKIENGDQGEGPGSIV